jgi:signal peptidase I
VRKIGSLGTMALAVVLFAVCMSVVAVRTLGMTTFVVTGASMEPTIHKGSLVIVEPVAPSMIRVGDVITFDHFDQITTHRVVSVDLRDPAQPIFTTKGDANVVADPEPVHFPEKVGLLRASVPLVGFGIAYAQAYWRLVITLIAAVAFLYSAASLLFRRRDERTRFRPALVPVTIDPDELWESHVGWLRDRDDSAARAA